MSMRNLGMGLARIRTRTWNDNMDMQDLPSSPHVSTYSEPSPKTPSWNALCSRHTVKQHAAFYARRFLLTMIWYDMIWWTILTCALSLESTSQFSPSTSFQPLCLCPSCSCSYHFFLLCQLTTLTIHNSISLSLPAQDLPLPQIFPSHRLPSSLRTDSTDFTTGPFLLSISVLCF